MVLRLRIRVSFLLALGAPTLAALSGACDGESDEAARATGMVVDAAPTGEGVDATTTIDEGDLPASDASSDAAAQPDGDAVAALTPLDACRAYVKAACDRRAECGLGTIGCMSTADSCPDVYLGPGSARTADSLFACATVRRTQACAEVAANVTPSCAPPGTRDAGEPCEFAAQCASFACSSASGFCGHCLPVRAPGTGCPGPTETCGYNMRCGSADAGCAPIAVATPLPEGSACTLGGTGDAGCPADAPCVSGTGGATTGTCARLPSSGACVFRVGSFKGACAAPTTCFGDAGACVGPGALGEPCAIGKRGCIESLRCDAKTGTCQARGQVDDPCASDADCEAALYCTSGAVEKCAPRAVVGQPCGFVDGGAPVECAAGSLCKTFVTDAGFASACAVRATLGEPCGAPFTECASPLVCTAGVCSLRACPADAGGD